MEQRTAHSEATASQREIEENLFALVERNRPMFEARSEWAKWSAVLMAIDWRNTSTWESTVAAMSHLIDTLRAVGRENVFELVHQQRPFLPVVYEALTLLIAGSDLTRVVARLRAFDNTEAEVPVHQEVEYGVWSAVRAALDVDARVARATHLTSEAFDQASFENVRQPPRTAVTREELSENATPMTDPGPLAGVKHARHAVRVEQESGLSVDLLQPPDVKQLTLAISYVPRGSTTRCSKRIVGKTIARLAHVVIDQADQDHTWVDLVRAGNSAGHWRLSNPDSLRKAGNRIADRLPAELKGHWQQSTRGVRWQSR